MDLHMEIQEASIKIQAAVDGNFRVGNDQNVRSSSQGFGKGVHQEVDLTAAEKKMSVGAPQ